VTLQFTLHLERCF